MLLIALLVPVLYVPQMKTNFDVLTDLPTEADSRLGYEAIAEHLGEDKLVQSTGLIDAGGGIDMLAPAQLAKLHDTLVALHESGGIATTTSLITPDGDTTIPDGFRPSATLREMADGFAGDDGGDASDSASFLDDEVRDGLNQALDYVNGVGVAFPDVAAGTAFRDASGGLADALGIVERVRDQSVLSTQLRTLSSSITSPANAAGGDDDSTLMTDYLEELGAAFPEVRTLDAYRDAVRAARSLERDASVDDALALSAAFDRLADNFDDQPDARLSPESLSGTPSAKALKAEAEQVFGDLPDQLGALSSVFATRADDIWIPTTFTGEDGAQVRDAIDAFVSADHSATRFYVTSASDPYSGNAFITIKDARTMLADAAAAFGPAASGHVGGPTAQFADVQDTLAADFQKVGLITVFGILLVLIVLLRAIVAPLYLVATVLISYGSTLGISAFLFQEVLGQPGISPYLPLMVFVLLVALGSDYNIFLMHRVREEAETRPMRDAVRIASGHTGVRHHLGRPDPRGHVRLDGDGLADDPVPGRRRGRDRRPHRHVPRPLDPRPGDHDPGRRLGLVAVRPPVADRRGAAGRVVRRAASRSPPLPPFPSPRRPRPRHPRRGNAPGAGSRSPLASWSSSPCSSPGCSRGPSAAPRATLPRSRPPSSTSTRAAACRRSTARRSSSPSAATSPRR